MKAYVVTRWQARGIEVVDVEPDERARTPADVRSVSEDPSLRTYDRRQHYGRGDWYPTPELAIQRVRRLASRETRRLKEALEKVESDLRRCNDQAVRLGAEAEEQ